ncbi:MAG: fused MFS/spermidine synthase [Verrucomicrobia bacterium]|nr:fused MFS/spermidine synthase [Verrucomicrobiota bacterium]
MTANNRSAMVTAIYLLLAFLSAFELFLIQPLIAKHILPWFGGAASVWTACLLFFQALLFVGYLYAYLVSLLRRHMQIVVHLMLLCLSIGAVITQQLVWGNPALPSREGIISGILQQHPTLAIVTVLALSVGLPYIALASTSPLVQSWFYGEQRDKKPLYFFYAVSNIGSLLALLAYPFILEPLLNLHFQALVWGIGFIAFAVVCAGCAIHTLTTRFPEDTYAAEDRPVSRRLSLPPWKSSLAWLGLSACASLMLVAMTNQICANVAPVPLLWLLPLSLYLLAFIICFSSRATWVPTAAALVVLPATALVLFVMKHALSLGILPQLAAYFLVLFCACLLCLGVLHRSRPSSEFLTFFYLMVSFGGALGGLFVGIVAPLIFTDYWELQIGMMLVCTVATWLLLSKPWASTWRIPILCAAVAILIAAAHVPRNPHATVVAKSRNFYGGLKVLVEGQPQGVQVFSMMHGRICHGLQFDRGQSSSRPSAYFGPDSGIGVAVATHPKRRIGADAMEPAALHIGVLGLGIGTIAAYGEPGDRLRFYEINPDVVQMATNSAYFRYLSGCHAQAEIVMGDARLSLEKELADSGPLNFDVLTLDVFNGDAIPTHLLTVQAFETYLAHLNPESGVLALHVTNMYLDLVPVIARIARHCGLYGCIVKGTGDLRLTSDSLWVLLSRDTSFMQAAIKAPSSSPLVSPHDHVPLWTDDFSNVLSIMKKSLFVRAQPSNK